MTIPDTLADEAMEVMRETERVMRRASNELTRLQNVNAELLEFVSEFVKNGCHHGCSTDSCSYSGQVRRDRAKRLLALFAKSEEA